MPFKCPNCKTILKQIGKDYSSFLRFFYCNKCGYSAWIDIKNERK